MSNIVRIAQIIGRNAKGGVESVVFNYYNFIDKSKFQFDLIIHSDSPYEIPDDIVQLGCKVYKVPPYKYLLSYIKALKHIFQTGNYEIVHSHMSTISVFTLFAAKMANIPVRIAHSHVTAGKGKGEFLRNIFKYILRLFSKLFPTHLFACSEYAGRWMFGNKAFEEGKITIINNAIDYKKFIYNKKIREKIRNSLNLKDEFVVGSVGRFMPQKNHDFLIDIFYDVFKKNNKSALLLIGDGELRTHIEGKVKRLNLQDNVFFLGVRDDVNELFQAMDVFVLPSLYEGLGMVAVEAQVSGLPTIVSNRLPNEVKLLNLIEFLDLNEKSEKWAESILSKRCFERLDISNEANIKKFSVSDEVKKLEAIYHNLISRRAQ